jgi:hypothetical protein
MRGQPLQLPHVNVTRQRGEVRDSCTAACQTRMTGAYSLIHFVHDLLKNAERVQKLEQVSNYALETYQPMPCTGARGVQRV